MIGGFWREWDYGVRVALACLLVSAKGEEREEGKREKGRCMNYDLDVIEKRVIS